MKHFLLLLLLPLSVLASESKIDLIAPVDLNDNASLQRGAQTFVNHCLNCHSANYMRYNRLVDIGLTEKQIKENLLFAGQKVGDPMTVTMDPKDSKKWFGKAPPDLSVEIRARGADWVYAYLRGFYKDDTRPSGWNNLVFDKVAMPHVLYQYQGEQQLVTTTDAHGHEKHSLKLVKQGSLSPSQYNAMVGDLTNYMAYMAEPGKRDMHKIGWYVLLFLGVLLVIVKKIKAAYWKDIK